MDDDAALHHVCAPGRENEREIEGANILESSNLALIIKLVI